MEQKAFETGAALSNYQSSSAIANENSAEGYYPESGENTSNNETEEQSREETNSPAQDMVIGGLWCLGGILVTAITYNAVKESGGTYVIAWGAVLYGGYQFLKGLFNSFIS